MRLDGGTEIVDFNARATVERGLIQFRPVAFGFAISE